ncbi:MAG: Asp-tRNA(Asn)/Glu-tRNA(Gln) amidotransferase subunit GatC [Propionibacteriaceae bacterium]|nr:Asp-tRNA(Asn)/Glu-tRNA(Gln) amidotransferase subunit GatC [Propionibacteriaceae bacterium]
MALDNAEVRRLADLARIELTDDELTALASQLGVVLEAVAEVSQVVDPSIRPTTHGEALTNVFRPDLVRPSLDQADVLAMAPAVEDERFRVPRILGESA